MFTILTGNKRINQAQVRRKRQTCRFLLQRTPVEFACVLSLTGSEWQARNQRGADTWNAAKMQLINREHVCSATLRDINPEECRPGVPPTSRESNPSENLQSFQ